MDHLIVLAGTMSSGKTTLLNALEKNKIVTAPESGRAILAEQRAFNGSGVPESDPMLFTQLMLSREIQMHQYYAHSKRKVVFDRAIPDMIAYAQLFKLDDSFARRAADVYRYNTHVYLLPSWKDIYVNDDERTMSFEQSAKFTELLEKAYQDAGYELIRASQNLCCAALRDYHQ